jgi:RND superfamily putative drug exporter
MQPRSLAARAGRWSAQHRKAAILGWLAFVIAAIAIGSAVGTKYINQDSNGVGESGRAQQVLHDNFALRAQEQVLVQSPSRSASDPAFRATVNDVVGRLSAVPSVVHLRSPLAPANRGAISRDGHSALVQFDIRGRSSDAQSKVGASLAATAAAQQAHPGFRIEQAGDASANKALSKSFSNDFAKARTLSLPITLIILVVAFGALVAAGIPVLLAITAVGATLGLVSLVSQVAAVDQAVSEVVLLVGMAVGVDYSLFYQRREREERARGLDEQAALQAAAATSGRAVMVSGLTVIAAMAGMYLAGDQTFASMATGTILVVAVAVIGSLTVLPALLSKLGDRVMKGRVPFVARRRETGAEPRLWSAVVDRVLRRPVVSTLVAGGLLLALAVPAFGLHTATPGLQGLPKGLPIVNTLNRIEAAFPGGPLPAEVVIQARDVNSPTVRGAIASMERQALSTGQMHQPFQLRVNAARDVAVVSVPLSGAGTDSASNRALDTLRGRVIPATVGAVPGVKVVGVTGQTAGSKDFNDSMKSHLPIVFGFVLTMAFLLLLVTFRSIVIPLTAIGLNLLSVGAAYGVLVLVFQHKWAEGLLDFKSTGAITSWLPLFLFVILFGLSMDYHVFILSRIRESHDRGMSTDRAIAHGIKSTAGPVTSAAIVMVAVFAIFGTLGALEFKQLGIGLAVAILLDATIIRAVLLPAVMKLLGEANWYLPRRLAWLPRVAHEPAHA